MKIRCLSSRPEANQLQRVGPVFAKQRFRITPGKEYLVIAMQFVVESKTLGTGTVLCFLNDDDRLSMAPLCLFEIADGRASVYWDVGVQKDGAVTLWPKNFYREYYLEDLFEDEPEIVKDFKQLYSLMQAESSSDKVRGD